MLSQEAAIEQVGSIWDELADVAGVRQHHVLKHGMGVGVVQCLEALKHQRWVRCFEASKLRSTEPSASLLQSNEANLLFQASMQRSGGRRRCTRTSEPHALLTNNCPHTRKKAKHPPLTGRSLPLAFRRFLGLLEPAAACRESGKGLGGRQRRPAGHCA